MKLQASLFWYSGGDLPYKFRQYSWELQHLKNAIYTKITRKLKKQTNKFTTHRWTVRWRGR